VFFCLDIDGLIEDEERVGSDRSGVAAWPTCGHCGVKWVPNPPKASPTSNLNVKGYLDQALS
jgi:hypothetical protein